MRAFWSDPYLWVHLAGLAVVPVGLEVCLVGLAMGDPLLPSWLEIMLVAIAGIAPILWMQWQRPFSIYSLVAVALTPSQLTDDQRRILKIFKSQESRILAAIAAFVLFLVLVKVYDLSPIATPVAPQLIGGRLTGLVIAAIAFLAVNLFVQVPVSVLRALAVSQPAFAETIPYPSEQVGRDFSLLGIGVKRILPPMVMEQPRPKPAPPVTAVDEPLVALEDDLWDESIAPATSMAEPLSEESVIETDSDTGSETTPIDAAIANDDAWEASDSVEEIAERGGDDISIVSVEAAIAQQREQSEAVEPEGVWETSVDLPIDEEAATAAVDEAAIAAPTEAPDPEGVWESSVELPLDEAAERVDESELPQNGLVEGAIADSIDDADAADGAVPIDMNVELTADEVEPFTEFDVSLPLDPTLVESTDVFEHADASAPDTDGLADDTRTLDLAGEAGAEENAPTVEQKPDDQSSEASNALEFEELFDDPQATVDSSIPDFEAEQSETDAVGHDLIPEWDDPPSATAENEQQG